MEQSLRESDQQLRTSLNEKEILPVEAIVLGVATAIPCGLIVNELVSNALKHAFANRAPGFIRVTLRESAPQILTSSVEDNGRGVPPDFDLAQTNSLGMQLVVPLVKQLGGEFEISRLQAGTRFTVRLTPPR